MTDRPKITNSVGPAMVRQINAALDWVEANAPGTGGGGGGPPASGSFALDDGTATASGVFLIDDGGAA